ncbi:hypothetical protein VTH06DRAFT_6174 [Thermothelomyces fergusii]
MRRACLASSADLADQLSATPGTADPGDFSEADLDQERRTEEKQRNKKSSISPTERRVEREETVEVIGEKNTESNPEFRQELGIGDWELGIGVSDWRKASDSVGNSQKK